MTKEAVLEKIGSLVGEIAAGKGLNAPTIQAETRLLGGGLPIDSLDLAGIVVELEAATGRDPFAQGFVDFRTAGELASLYVQ